MAVMLLLSIIFFIIEAMAIVGLSVLVAVAMLSAIMEALEDIKNETYENKDI